MPTHHLAGGGTTPTVCLDLYVLTVCMFYANFWLESFQVAPAGGMETCASGCVVFTWRGHRRQDEFLSTRLNKCLCSHVCSRGWNYKSDGWLVIDSVHFKDSGGGWGWGRSVRDTSLYGFIGHERCLVQYKSFLPTLNFSSCFDSSAQKKTRTHHRGLERLMWFGVGGSHYGGSLLMIGS